MPQVAERLRQEFDTEPQMHEPDQSVAKGAAIYGQKLAIGRRINIEIAKELGTDPERGGRRGGGARGQAAGAAVGRR